MRIASEWARKPSKALAVVTCLVLSASMAGCAPQVDAEITCQSAFDALAPIEPVDGLDMLISDDVAATVEHCESIQQWIDQLSAHPDVVALKRVDRNRALYYLALSCQLLADQSRSAAVCVQAESEGLFLPQ